MKKTIAMAAAMIVSFSAVCMNSFADDTAETKVYVTISDKENNFALTQKPVTVTDTDNDGKLTLTDALYCAHEENFEGGAKEGYVTSESDGYVSVLKLWGIENSMSYLFHVNSGMAGSMTAEIKDGDYVDALMFPDPKDLNYYYSWFDQRDGGEVDPDTEVELKLSYATFDADFNTVVNPLADAKITINGKETDFVTDAEGKVTVKFTNAGENVVSATSDTVKIAPASYIVNVKGEAVTTSTETTTTVTTTTTTVTAKTTAKTTKKANTTTAKNSSPKTGDTGSAVAFFAVGAAVATAFTLRRRNEK